MNKFNKLYNLILLSIITLNSETRKAMILKSNNIENKNEIIMYLTSIAGASSNKAADFLCKFFCSGLIKSTLDPKIQQVINILLRKTNIDIQKDITLNEFLKQNEKYLIKTQASNSKYLDSVKEFKGKRVLRDGIVIYDVEDSKDGMYAVRNIVDKQLGYNANPWCLIAREEDPDRDDDEDDWDESEKLDEAWRMWRNYWKIPKRIAFQNGKVLAFSANSERKILWWNLQDKPSELLIDKKGKEVAGTGGQTVLMSLVTLNKNTGYYDCNGDLEIEDGDLVNGLIPINLGVVEGNFSIQHCKDIISLKNGPLWVKGNCHIFANDNLETLKGGPQKVDGYCRIEYCSNLLTLLGAPKEVGGWFTCEYCHNLKSLKGCPLYVKSNFSCNECTSLVDLKGAPKKVDGDFYCGYCSGLNSLLGAPEYVGGDFICNHCNSLINLIGSPNLVKKSYYCYNCTNLTTLEGVSKQIGYNLYCSWCRNLQYADGLLYVAKKIEYHQTMLQSKYAYTDGDVEVYGKVRPDLFNKENYKNS